MESCSKSAGNSIDGDQESLQIIEESRKRRRSCDDEVICLDVDCSVSSAPVTKKEKSTNATVCKSEQDGSDDSMGLYGLKPEYLKMLGITPPLHKWIHVSNFRCDKSDLRDVLELAGHVVICSVVTIRERYAKVKYSHPLEAVQAISMLNNQKFYGQTLKVVMSHCPIDTYILPKGLNDIGPGLGIGGKPVRDIVKEYDKFTEEKESLLNTSLFSKTGECATKCDDNKVDNVSIKTIDSWDGDWFVKDEIKDDQSDDSIDLNNFSKKRRFMVRNVEDSDDSHGFENESDNKNKTNKSSPPIDAPGVSPPPTQLENNVERYESPTLPKRSNSAGSQSTQGSSTSAPSRNLRPTIQTEVPIRPPGVNSSSTYGSIGLRPIASISGPNAPVMRPNAPNCIPTGLVPNSVCPVPRPGGPVLGPNGVPGSNIPILGSRPNVRPPIGPMVAHNGLGPNPILPVPCPMLGPRPNLGGVMSNGSMIRPNAPMGPVPNYTKTATLEFRNLPPSTTFAILCDKMSECGQVLSIQMTTPGCAIVKYLHIAHADVCFQRYNRTIVEGCLIEARFI